MTIAAMFKNKMIGRHFSVAGFVFVGIIMGVTLAQMGDKAFVFLDFFRDVNLISTKMVDYAIWSVLKLANITLHIPQILQKLHRQS